MSDRSDWSIGSESRFVEELEVLDLDVPILLFGSVMKTFDMRHGHYRSSPARTGWALAQCKNHEGAAKELRSAIADKRLDDDNRIILYQVYRAMLFRECSISLGKGNWKVCEEQADKKIKPVISMLPANLRKRVAGFSPE